jgi:HAD superfamily phosphatase (TIGR01668 family)
MKLLKARAYFKNITEISPEFLKENGISGLILDIDNTLIGHNVPLPDEKTTNHLRVLENAGIKLCVVSNNTYDRVKSFTEKIGVEFFVANALKPRKKGYLEASECMKLPLNEIGAVGDQLFTDIWGGNWLSMHTVLVKPISDVEDSFVKFKRRFEKKILAKMK